MERIYFDYRIHLRTKRKMMRARALCSKVFMDVSESRIDGIRWTGSDDEQWYVNRLFDTPETYGRWESTHFSLMNKIALSNTVKGQIVGLRKTWFTLVQRQSLFQHLRESQVTGREREILISAFHASSDYSKAVAQEHGHFLCANTSLLCSVYLGSALMNDDRFNAELASYHSGYMEFFSLFCDWIIAEERGQNFMLRPVLSKMKHDLSQMQVRLLAMPIARNRRRAFRPVWN
jgi:hypothetical protein